MRFLVVINNVIDDKSTILQQKRKNKLDKLGEW